MIPCRVFARWIVPSSGSISPVSSLSRVVLPVPLAPTTPIRSPRWMRRVKSRTMVRSPKRLVDLLGVDHHLGLHVVIREPELRRSGRAEHRGSRGAHLVQLGEAALVAPAPGGDSALQPVELELQLRVEPLGVARLLRIDRLGPGVEAAEADLGAAQSAAVEPERGAGEALQEGAVVADRDEGAGVAAEPVLEPFDRGEVEMVGRLVEQQHVGILRKRPGDRGPAPLAAGRGCSGTVEVDPELVGDRVDLMRGRRLRAVEGEVAKRGEAGPPAGPARAAPP